LTDVTPTRTAARPPCWGSYRREGSTFLLDLRCQRPASKPSCAPITSHTTPETSPPIRRRSATSSVATRSSPSCPMPSGSASRSFSAGFPGALWWSAPRPCARTADTGAWREPSHRFQGLSPRMKCAMPCANATVPCSPTPCLTGTPPGPSPTTSSRQGW